MSDSPGFNHNVMIAVMGPTGSGKTTFVNSASGSDLEVGYGLGSCTTEVTEANPFKHGDTTVTLLDTPGFDGVDSERTEGDVLNMIRSYLAEKYGRDQRLDGFIYLHRMSDSRKIGIARKNLKNLRSLCGEKTLKNVLIVTNMWSDMEFGAAETREQELASSDEFYRSALDKGAHIIRHPKDEDEDSAALVISEILRMIAQPPPSEEVDVQLPSQQTGEEQETEKQHNGEYSGNEGQWTAQQEDQPSKGELRELIGEPQKSVPVPSETQDDLHSIKSQDLTEVQEQLETLCKQNEELQTLRMAERAEYEVMKARLGEVEKRAGPCVAAMYIQELKTMKEKMAALVAAKGKERWEELKEAMRMQDNKHTEVSRQLRSELNQVRKQLAELQREKEKLAEELDQARSKEGSQVSASSPATEKAASQILEQEELHTLRDELARIQERLRNMDSGGRDRMTEDPSDQNSATWEKERSPSPSTVSSISSSLESPRSVMSANYSGFCQDNAIIAVMGATGSGKSTFISTVSGSNLESDFNLQSSNVDIRVAKPFMLNGKTVTLVDFPGLDDMGKTETETLKFTADFLATLYQLGRTFHGIVYLHRISDYRMGGVAERNFRLFKKLCGEQAFKNILFVTNMWGTVANSVGEAREYDLSRSDMFFKPIIEKGGKVLRHDNTLQSACRIIEEVTSFVPEPLLIQREIVEQNKYMAQTSLGMEFRCQLECEAKLHREDLKALKGGIEEILATRDGTRKEELQELKEDLAEARERLEKVDDGIRKLQEVYVVDRRIQESMKKMVEVNGNKEAELRIRHKFAQGKQGSIGY